MASLLCNKNGLYSGLISFENLKRVTQVIGTYLTDEEIEEMIDDADKDYDGYVSCFGNEFSNRKS